MSAEATVVRNYLDWMLSIPWGKTSRTKKDLGRAQKVLDDDHYGLEKVKERIVEYLAVQQRSKEAEGPDPVPRRPSGRRQDLAWQIGRQGHGAGVHPHLAGWCARRVEIRGHRRTYIGSMPGKIIQALKKAKKTNPLILLDEIDKMGRTSGAIPLRPCWRCWTPNRTRPSSTTTSRWNTTCRT
jgi:ATP-dependent Lon protease